MADIVQLPGVEGRRMSAGARRGEALCDLILAITADVGPWATASALEAHAQQLRTDAGDEPPRPAA